MTSRVVRILLTIAVLATALITATAGARRPIWRPVRQNFSVALMAGHGGPLRTFSHHGQIFVLGEPGERYAIRVQNPTARRVEAVISVDGRDAISGQVADFVRQRGYVLEPFASMTIEGFRTSLDEVHAFRFTDPGRSYAARSGTPENVGVVGVAFFPERERRPQPIARRDWTADAPRSPKASAKRSAAAHHLGTGFGEARVSAAVEVTFVRERATRPAQIVTVRYDDADGLAARGIDVFGARPWQTVNEPEPFPHGRFAQPPE